MDRIKPIDLQKTSIPRIMRGYDPKIVDVLLDRSSSEIEELLTEQMRMKSELDRLKSEVQSYRSLETNLRDALVIAQKAADETRMNAHREAELMIESAKQRAAEEQAMLASEIKSLLSQIDALRHEKERFDRQFRVLLEDHLRELDQTHESPRAVVVADVGTPIEA